jgi:hypothetical protein
MRKRPPEFKYNPKCGYVHLLGTICVILIRSEGIDHEKARKKTKDETEKKERRGVIVTERGPGSKRRV